MLAAVYFDNEQSLMADEVDDIFADWDLSPEFESVQLS